MATTKNKVTTPTNRLEKIQAIKFRTDLPAFKSGDKLVIRSKIKEGEKERVQAYEGVVIAMNGRGIQETITVRKVSSGVGVERVYPIHSPTIVSIEVKNEGFVRRSKLYYLRGLEGKSARIRDKNLKLLEAQGAAAKTTTEA
ncbi:MAG: 50S ribosomal protein L19 [Bdellovibrionales bacterium]|nr:50S ribosomal protein L19 [Bdellovibrionales bacterium]